MKIKIWNIIANFSIAISIFLLAMGFYRYKNTVSEIILPIIQSNGENTSGVQILVKLIYPQKVSHYQKIYFQFELSQIISTKSEKLEGNVKVDSSDLIDQYNINFESQLELPGILQDPSGKVGQKFVKNKPLNFDWKLFPINRGTYQGTLWLYVNLIPENPSGKPIKKTILAKPIQIEVSTIFGLSSYSIKIFGIVILVLSLILKLRLYLLMNKKEMNKKVELKIN